MGWVVAYLGLGRPRRFGRLLAAVTALALLAILLAAALALMLAGRLDPGTPRAAYFIYVSGVLLAALLLVPWPRLASVALSLAALEIGLGLGSALLVTSGLAEGSIFPVNYTAEPRFDWHPLLQAVPRPTPSGTRTAYFHNSQRLRGRERTAAELRAKTVIALFGGSSTYDQGVPDGSTWAEQLERRLGARHAVLNHGMGGYSTAEHVVQTAFYQDAWGVPPNCALYYVGWNDLHEAHLPGLDPGYADYHLREQIDAEEVRRLGGRSLSPSPLLTYAARLVVLAVDTPRPALWPGGPTRADPDPRLEAIFARNVATISAINRRRGIATIWVGQLMNRSLLARDLPNRWIPLVMDRDLWPLVARLNAILQREAARLGDVYVDVPVEDFSPDDFVDQGHFSTAGAAKFADRLAPTVGRVCP
jgi:hypothetical protein